MRKREDVPCAACGEPFVPSDEDRRRCANCFTAKVEPVWRSDDDSDQEEE